MKTKGQSFRKGRSKKESWKKIQHDDIESFLDEVREDERLGGIRNKKDSDLFLLDTFGDFGVPEAPVIAEQVDKKETNKKSGRLVDLDSLRCYQVMKPNTKVPDPLVKRNTTRKPGSGKTLDMKMKDETRYYKQKLRNSKSPNSSVDKLKIPTGKKGTADTDTDLWGTSYANPHKANDNVVDADEWLTDDAKRQNLRIKKTNFQRRSKTSDIAAVELPHPGLSYNPTFKAHQDILSKAVTEEQQRRKAEQKLLRATAVPKSAFVKDEIKEDSDDDIEIKEESDDDVKPKLLSKPKTKKQRRKELEQLEIKRAAQAKKDIKTREADVFRAKSIVKGMKQRETVLKEKLKRKAEEKAIYESVGQKTLSKTKFRNLPLNPTVSSELSGKLVSTAPESGISLLLDRFNSLQKRNVLEPRDKYHQKRKYKLRKYQRPSDKMEWEVTGTWNGIKLFP